MFSTEFCKGCLVNDIDCSGNVKVDDGEIAHCTGRIEEEYYTYAELMEFHKTVWNEMYNRIVTLGLNILSNRSSVLKQYAFDKHFTCKNPKKCFGCLESIDSCKDCFLNLDCDYTRYNGTNDSLYFKFVTAFERKEIEVLEYIKQIRNCGFAPGIDKNSNSNIKKSEVIKKEVVATDSISDIRRVAKVLAYYHIDALPVIENKRLVGIVTRGDILRGFAENPKLNLWA